MDQELVLEERTSGSRVAHADGQPGVWTETGRLNIPRFEHTATLLQNGMVLAHGGGWRSYVNGVFTDHGRLSSAELFNTATGKWALAPSAFYERFGHTATLLRNGKVLVVGGNATTNTELFDPARGWFATGELNTPRAGGHAATALADGRVLVLGGQTDLAIPSFTTSAEIYDPTTQAWTPTGSLGHVRYGASATLLLDGRVLVVGGANTQLAELFDPATGQWHFTAGPSHSGGSTTLLKDGRVLFAGGNPDLPGSVFSSRTVELLDPAQLTWRRVGFLNVGRGGHTAILLSSGKVLVAGGTRRVPSSKGTLPLQSAELFDPTTLKWTLTAPPNAARSDHTATLMRPDRFRQDRVLVAGGNDGPFFDNSVDSTELCLLGAIVKGPPLPPPSARTKSMQ